MQRYPQLITAPASEPLTTAEAKTHLRVEHTDDDTYIDTLIVAARMAVENYTNRRLINQTWEVTRSNWADTMYLSGAPLSSVTSVTYIDSDGNSQTLSTAIYEADTVSEPGAVRRTYLQFWPVLYPVWNAVVIRYVAGYGTSGSDVPEAIRQAMLLHIGHLYEHRESVSDFQTHYVSHAYDALLHPYKVWT